MRAQAIQIAKGLWEANQELAEEIANEIYQLRGDTEVIKKCESCKFWNLPNTAEVYGVDVCSQYHKAKFNQKDRALVKIRTEADFYCSLWESRDE